MSLSKEVNLTLSNAGEGGDNSDQSLSDSWTVLDSSHFKEDGDLSDAESVEVLHEEHTADDNVSGVKIGDDGASDTSTTTAAPDSDEISPTPGPETEELEAASPSDDGESCIGEKDDNPAPDPPRKAKPRRSKKKYVFQGVPIEVVGEPFSTWLLQIAIYSLFVDMVLLCYFGLSSLTGLLELPTPQYLKPSKPYHAFEMEPLSLQFSHVLAEWKKHPLQDHSLDRLVLKTLLLHYGGSSELSANLYALSEKVQKHNDLIKRLGREQEWKELQHHRMVTSAHIAHAIACILGKQDNDRAVPAELFVNHTKHDIGEFSPEPGFWLNDWHLPQYFRANDTYYRIDTKPVLPPMHKLYLHLGSTKWNEYFWKLRMGNEKENEGEDKSKTADKSSESELEGEETQRSPLDLSASVDFISDEESSGNLAHHTEESSEELDSFIYQEIGDPEDLESVAHIFKLFNVEEHADASEYISRYPGRSSVAKAAELNKKGRLSEWYEELAMEEQQNEHPVNREWYEELALEEQQSEQPVKSEWYDELTLEEKHNEQPVTGFERFAENPEAGNLNSFFEELVLDESQDEAIFGEKKRDENSKKQGNENEELDKPQNVEAFDGWYMVNPKNDKVSKQYQEHKHGTDKSVEDKDRKEKVRQFIDEISADGFNYDDFGKKFNEYFPEKKPKSKGGKRRFISNKYDDNENGKGKLKQKKKTKGRPGFDSGDSEEKKKINKKKRDSKKELKFDDKIPRGPNNRKKRLAEADWNSRMAEGREKLRALNGKGVDDQIWVFERAKARRDLREEIFTE